VIDEMKRNRVLTRHNSELSSQRSVSKPKSKENSIPNTSRSAKTRESIGPSSEDHRLEEYVTDSGIELKKCYGKEDLSSWEEKEKLGAPGNFPFTRGPYETMYRGRVWTMRQYSGMGDARASNKRFKYLLSEGQTGLSVAFDLPTQLGYDSDDVIAMDDVGVVGVAISSLRDMEKLFDGIPVEKISTHLNINATAPIIFAMYLALAEKRGIPVSGLRGTLQNDILKEFLARKAFIFPPRPSVRLVADIIEYSIKNTPEFNPISVTGFHVKEMGANSTQEVAFCLSDAIAYCSELVQRGIDFDDFAPNLSFHFACGRDFFEEIAKFRAARRIWAQVSTEKFHAKKLESSRLRFFSGGSGAVLPAQEPLNNVIRSSLQCLASVLGGAQSIHVMAYDEAHGIPTEESAKLCLRTQQIVAYESGIPNVVDPLGGSYYIEWLTDEIEKKIVLKMREIEQSWGGMIQAIVSGLPQKEVLERAYQIEKEIESGKRVIVGQNLYGSSPNTVQNIRIQKQDNKAMSDQIVSVKRLKSQRKKKNQVAVSEALNRVRETAKDEKTNIIPVLKEAVKSYATVGEITSVLKEVFGTYKDPGLNF
jgi:methylmalonyl-CoA mutase, N-terminal domain